MIYNFGKKSGTALPCVLTDVLEDWTEKNGGIKDEEEFAHCLGSMYVGRCMKDIKAAYADDGL